MPEAEPKKKKKIKVPRVVNGMESEVEIEVDDSAGPAWGPNDSHRLLNKPIQRVDGPVKVNGAAIYTHDVRLAGMLFGRILRCPHAHAKVTRISLDAARKIPGVRAAVESSKEALFEGSPIAAVAATTPEAAEDAARAIAVEYEILPHVVTAADAIQPGAPRVFPDDPGASLKENVKAAEKHGDPQATLAALATADAVVDAQYRTPVIHHACLETHGVVVDYRGGDQATVYASTQGTFSIPGDAAKSLGLPHSAVSAVVQHMGGGFGSKFGIGIEGKLACALAKEAGAPVKLMLTRQDEFLLGGNRSGSWQKFKAGAAKDGTLLAVHAQQFRLGGIGHGAQAGQPYLYNATQSFRDVSSIHTNVDASRAMRAPGHPQASFAMESLMDELAHKLGLDPVAFRKKNLKDPVHHRQLDRGAKEIGWDKRSPTPGSTPGALKRGFGCAVGAWGGGGSPQCVVTVNISRDGSVNATVGTQDLGTGTRTYLRAIVAEELGLGVSDVSEKIGDSRLGAANASGGSMTTASLAPAIKVAAFNARTAMAQRVASVLNVQPEDVVFKDAAVSAKGKSLPWKQACAALPAAGISQRGEWQADLAAGGVHGACFAQVEVDVETGRVRPVKIVHIQDVGLPLNRLALESQINGAMIQAMGMALLEQRVMDAKLGVMLNPGFEDYKIPGALEIPELVPIIDDQDTRQAVIGVGEPPVIPAVGALANAVFNACGVRVRDLPITPDKILNGLAAGNEKT